MRALMITPELQANPVELPESQSEAFEGIKALLTPDKSEPLVTITPVWLGNCCIWCDEDGLPKRLPINLVASQIIRQNIVGSIIVVGNDGSGDITSLSQDVYADLQRLVKKAREVTAN